MKKGIRTVNMLGCHDGIPVLDLKGADSPTGFRPGLLSDDQIDRLRQIGGTRIAAPPAGASRNEPIDLLAAAERANNPSLKRFLELRAGALLSDDFYDSEVAWMRLSDNLIEPTLGPYENYEDQLFGYKISYESFIGLKDPAESERLAGLVENLPDLEASLPIPDEHKYLDRSFESPISVVTLVYAAGETAAGIQTIAFNLPNDPRVREGEGSKKVFRTCESPWRSVCGPASKTSPPTGS